MLTTNKKKSEFLFIESRENVLVYRSKNKEVEKITEFMFGDLSISLASLKKNFPELSRSKNIWLLSSSIENIEKPPASLGKLEMLTFAKYKIQELVDIPINDLSFDLLTNNDIEAHFFKKYATAVIVKKSHINYILKAFTEHKVKIEAIDTTKTASLDFFERQKDLFKKKVVTYLKLEYSRALMCVYHDSGLVFERIIELPILKDYESKISEVTKEVYDLVFEKLCLEMQRNVDFLDRQLGVPHFEKIAFSLPKQSLLKNLSEDLMKYFNVDSVEVGSKLIYKSSSIDLIPIEVLAFFERGSVRSEHINLIPQIPKTNTLSDDVKKVLMASLILGVVGAGFGSYYEMQAIQLTKLASSTEKEVDGISREILQIKQQKSNPHIALEEDIKNLERNKNEIINAQSQNVTKATVLFNKIVEDIAIQAKNSGITLHRIKLSEIGLHLEGSVISKDRFSAFLINLKNSEQLKGKSLNLINMEKENDIFRFTISSENMGGN